MTLTVIIQIDAIDAVHVFVADILAHYRQDGPSHVMVIEIHNLTICIFVNRISQGAFALQYHCEGSFLVDDSHIERLVLFSVGIGFHSFIDQFLQSHIHSHAVRQFTGLDKGAHLIQELFGALGNRCTNHAHVEHAAEHQVENDIEYLGDDDTTGDEARTAVGDDVGDGHTADGCYEDGEHVGMNIGLQHGQQLALLPPTNGRVVVFVLHLKIRFNTGYLCILYVK